MNSISRYIIILISTVGVGVLISWIFNGQKALEKYELLVSISGSFLGFIVILLYQIYRFNSRKL